MRKTLIILLMIVLSPVPVMAQTDKHVALGAEIGLRKFVDDDFSRKNPSFSILYRLSRHPSQRKEGWVWRVGGTVGYSRANFDTDVGGIDTEMGSLRTIPALGGIERAYRHDRMKVALSVLAGPSFNKFSVDTASREAYEARLGVPLENIEVKNSLAVRSGVGVWYDLSRWVGLHAGAYYLYHRPSATTTAGGVSSSETWRMDRVSVSTGFAIGIF
jgi:hypothetical protein